MHATKSDLRRQYASVRDGLSPSFRASAEEIIREKLFSLSAWQNAALICGYMTQKSEIDLSPVWARAIRDGKSYALPVTVTDRQEGRMVFRRLSAYAPNLLQPARFGIYEPPPTCPTLSPEDFENALIIVPGLVFDQSGYRLGYGGGYYDRFLASLEAAGVHVITVGLAFSACRTDSLPHETHDRPVSYVIDERRSPLFYGFT